MSMILARNSLNKRSVLGHDCSDDKQTVFTPDLDARATPRER